MPAWLLRKPWPERYEWKRKILDYGETSLLQQNKSAENNTLDKNGKLVRDEKELANVFNNFFAKSEFGDK